MIDLCSAHALAYQLLNSHYDEYAFQPIVVFDGDGWIVTAMLRPFDAKGAFVCLGPGTSEELTISSVQRSNGVNNSD
jgi:hypothetical protein